MHSDAATLYLILPLAALALDLLLGDPHAWPHPVKFIGNILSALEDRLLGPRQSASTYRNVTPNHPPSFLFRAGVATMVVLCALSWLCVTLLGYMGWLGLLVLVYVAYAGLALGCLLKEFDTARGLIAEGRLEDARRAVGMLVSRDTDQMDEDDLRRSLAETLSENLNDGFVAPFFYLSLFGPAALWMYKTVSTMDSMWGYKTPRYDALGKCAAITDDVLAYVPARLTAAALIAVSCPQQEWRSTWSAVRFDAHKMSSPNAGWPMASAAHLIGATMGGKTPYHGIDIIKPSIGPTSTKWSDYSLLSLRKIVFKTSIALSFFLWGVGLLFNGISRIAF